MFGNKRLTEAGRKISATNEQKVRDALQQLSDLLSVLEPAVDPESDFGAQVEAGREAMWLRAVESIAPSRNAKVHSLSEIREALSVLTELELVEKDYPTEKRVELAKKGLAMPVKDENGEIVNGKYPIAEAGDVTDAVRRMGSGNAPNSEIKAHIVRAAKKIGATSALPDSWKGTESEQDDDEPNLVEAGVAPISDAPLPLKERALAKDGIIETKIIGPGWGTTGYYGADVLSRDGAKAFKAGTKMFWDHPTRREEAERPERSIRDLAAELVEDARWESNHKRGPGLYAKAKVFSNYREAIEELSPHIGVSIRAWGKGRQGEAEGRKGSIVTAIEKASSIDFVTVAGAGGEINTRFVEAGRLASSTGQQLQETSMDSETDTKLREAEAKVSAMETELREAQQRAERAETAVLIREAGDVVRAELAKITTLPEVTKSRLTERLGANPPVKDGQLEREALVTSVTEAAREESEYLAKVTGRSVAPEASISSREAGRQTTSNALVEVFQSFGMSESAANIAANGR